MEIRQMRYFLAVAETLHFRRAADLLHLSQPSLSLQIRQMEEELGAQLFERTQRRVRLTAAGEALVPRLRTLLRSLDEAINETQRIDRGLAGPLTMGFVSTALVGRLPGAMKELQTTTPGLRLQLKECDPREQIAQLMQGRLEIAFIHGQLEERSLETLVLQRDRMIAALPEDVAPEGEVDLRAFAGYTSIMPSPVTAFGFFDHVQRAYQQAGVSPAHSIHTNLIIGGINLVAAGIGIALVPSSFEQMRVPGVAYRPLAVTPPAVELLAVWKRDDASAMLNRFVEILRRHAED